MAFIVIGSAAAHYHIPSWREPKDLDVFTQYQWPSGVSDKPLEAFWHPSFEAVWPGHTTRLATLDELYTIKVSHSYWALENGTWEKHMHDIVQLKNAGAKLDLDLHNMLYKVWAEKHGKKRVNLQMVKDDFFTDAVKRIYDHDSIHYSVAYGDKPIYEAVFENGQEIAMDMSKIKLLPHDLCVKLFREEVYATALERWVIPTNYRVSPMLAYSRALKKTITSLTKGWSARFIVENYETFRRPDIDYVSHHKSKAHLLIPLDMEK